MRDLTGIEKRNKAAAYEDLAKAITDYRQDTRIRGSFVQKPHVIAKAADKLSRVYERVKGSLDANDVTHAGALKAAEDYLGIEEELRIIKVKPDENETTT